MIRGILSGALLLLSGAVYAGDVEDGDTAYQAGDYAMAELKYKAAIADNRKAVRAYLGVARVNLATGNQDVAADAIKTGLKYAKDRGDKLDLYATSIRVEDARGEHKAAKKQYNRAKRVKGYQQHGEVHVALAHVYMDEKDFEKAEDLLTLALASPGEFGQEAENLLANLQLVEKAVAVTDSQFAYAPSVSRAQVAVLLVDDLDIASRLEADTSEQTLGEVSDQGLTDYANSPYKEAIVTTHRLGLRSFKITNGAFRPTDSISRANLAMLSEDILHEKKGVSRTSFIGTNSPFSDLDSSATAFNAIMTAVTRGLMQGNQDGMIHPDELVSGAEAILVLHELDKQLGK